MRTLNLTKIIILVITIFFNIGNTKEKRKYLWFDATANFERLSFPDSIKYYLNQTKNAGFTDVVLDIKPITGEVLYESSFVPQMTEWQNKRREKSFDFINTFIGEAKKLELRVHCSMNVFVGGHNFFDRGLVYDDRKNWQSILYTDSGMVPITELKHKYSAMLNPADKEIQKYELNVIKEVVTKYKNLDGIILDRVRFDGIEADFSEISRIEFEKYIKEKIVNFPNDIYKWEKDANNQKIRMEGKLYKKWLCWRASVIYDFVKVAQKIVKEINPDLGFQIYVGAWYPVYFDVGVNWASKNYDPSVKYEWATNDYKNYGYAELVDILLTGNYFYEVEKTEVAALNSERIKRGESGMGAGKEFWYSVEGSAEVVKEVILDAAPVIGSLYVEQYKDHPEQFKRAIEMCLNKTDGLMIFDIVHIINYGWWQHLKLN